MKKVKFKSAGKAVYAALCVGLVAVGIASAAGYRAAVNSVTDGLITQKDDANVPDIDYSAVDAILDDIAKEQKEASDNFGPGLPGSPIPMAIGDASSQAPTSADGLSGGENGALSGAPADIPSDNYSDLPADVPSDDALLDITDELEALYYEQAVVMPVNGEILTAFSEGELVKTSGGVWRTHDGIDIGAAEGSEVKAMTSGTVTGVYKDPLWGCCVTVDHGNTLIGCYYGLSEDISVAEGDHLNSGDKIGTVGNTADIEAETPSHLHFALKYENNWIDPVSYIEPMK